MIMEKCIYNERDYIYPLYYKYGKVTLADS